MAQSGVHKLGYERLRQHLNLPAKENRVLNINTRQARFDEDIQETLGIDAVMVGMVHNWVTLFSTAKNL